jgi:hypothetical protein
LSKTDYQFDEIEDFQRNREIEGKTGAIFGWPGDRWMRVLAATDANSRWRSRQQKITAEVNRLRNANASPQQLREYLARQYAECLVIDWGGWKSHGVDIPFSVDACTALLTVADDVFAVIDNSVYETKLFRGARIEAVADELKN